MKKLKLACCVLLMVQNMHQSFAQTKKPNIILILADDLGYGDIGCYGQQKIETPNLNKLAKMGVKFTQFYSGSAVCAPARCALMTGMHTGHAAIRGNVTIKPEGQMPLPDSIITFPILLQKAGYTTAAFGKWSLGFITTAGDPQKKGFDEFYGYNCQTLAHNYYPDHLWHNHDRVDLAGNLKYDSVYSADLIHRQAMQFLKARKNEPFFLYLPYTLPHADVIVPHDEAYEHYVKKFNELPAIPVKNDEENSHYDPFPHAAYAAMVTRLDKFVGEIMELLKDQKMEENTLLIFTSDNGPHKEKGGDPVFFNNSGGFRGIKRDLYEGGIREPFIAYQKGVTRAGTVNEIPAALWDLFPTFLEMTNVKFGREIDGVSILPSMKGQKQKPHEYFYWELHESGGKQAVRMGKWKAIRLNVSTTAPSAVELYHLEKDPREKNNIAAQHPGIVKQAEAFMKGAYRPNPDWPLFFGEKK
jgi:arylsulfatase A